MNLPLAQDWLVQGHCAKIVCLDTNRILAWSRKSFLIDFKETLSFAGDTPAILTAQEQSSQNWAVYRLPTDEKWLTTLLSGRAITENKGGFRFVHQVRDGVVWSAKVDATISTFEDLRNWFWNKPLTDVVFGSYEIE